MSATKDMGAGAPPSVLLIGGTVDSRALARALGAEGVEVTLCAMTEYGGALAADDAAAVRSGPLDAASMAALAAGSIAIVDASHPFASGASACAREAAGLAGVGYVRFERPPHAAADGVIVCASPEQAAHEAVRAAGSGGTVLLTVGSRTLSVYAEACRAADVRCIARVLPVVESLEACERAGLAPADIIAMQGPATAELDAALLRHLGATVLVTKDSGDAGGVPEKLEAAAAVGAVAIVVSRPAQVQPDATHSIEEAVARVLSLGGLSARAGDSRQERHPGLVHVYTGDGKGKTTASVGLAVRAVGAGLHVAFVQFVKGGAESSELGALRRLGVRVERPALHSSGLMRGGATQADRDAAARAVAIATEVLGGEYDLVVLDEACVAARKGLVDPGELAQAIRARAPHVEVALTGRGAVPELLELADYITELEARRHPLERGIPARKGVEY